MILGADCFKTVTPQFHNVSEKNYNGNDIRYFSGNSNQVLATYKVTNIVAKKNFSILTLPYCEGRSEDI
jgi:hypothetical protein